MRERQRRRRTQLRPARRRRTDDAGFSMISIALSLVATALLVALLLSTTLKSSTTGNTSISNAPGVAQATAVQAQQTLSSGLSAVNAAASGGDGYGSLSAAALTASEPSTEFVNGPSTGPTTISLAVTGGSEGAAVGVGGGSVTLADRSTNGTCWLIWKSTGSATWYGAQTGVSSCTAPELASTPTPGPVSSASIGWQQGSFPPA